MKFRKYGYLILALACAACSSPKDADREYKTPVVSENTGSAMAPDTEIPKKMPIDPGDVDSGVFIDGKLAPASEALNVSVEYIETQRSTLSMTIITVKPPFPETLFLFFEVITSRDFVERPVVMRARAYRDDAPLGDEHGFVLGKNARFPMAADGTAEEPRGFTVDVMEGLSEIPDSLLLHARADAWLMPEGTDESTLNPLSDTAPDQVSILSNPVRINFVKEEANQ